MAAPTVNEPPSILWPTPPDLPLGAHVWVVGGSLPATGVRCEMVAADHVIELKRHAVMAGVERLAPVTELEPGRQYQLRIRSSTRTDIVGVWTVVPPMPPPLLVRCARDGDRLRVRVDSVGLVHVGDEIAAITGDASFEVAGPVTIRVLAGDGAVVDERTTP